MFFCRLVAENTEVYLWQQKIFGLHAEWRGALGGVPETVKCGTILTGRIGLVRLRIEH